MFPRLKSFEKQIRYGSHVGQKKTKKVVFEPLPPAAVNVAVLAL